MIPKKFEGIRYSSPWGLSYRMRLLLWEYVWALVCFWTPKPFNPWRLLVLKAFGATIYGDPFVHQRARIEHPWNLTLYHQACLGDRSHVYCLAGVEVHSGACVAQEAYLCTGTHDFSQLHWPLQTAPIIIGQRAFIGARAFVLPGITIGEFAIVGAGSVVTKAVPSSFVVAGNPARSIGGASDKKS